VRFQLSLRKVFRARPQTALRRLSDDRLVDLDCHQPGVERITLADRRRKLLVQVSLHRFDAAFDNLLNFARRGGRPQGRGFLELSLFIRQLADFIGINALEALLQFIALLHECDIGGAELFELRLLHRAVHVQVPRAITLDIQVREFRRNLVLRFDLKLDCHNFRCPYSYTLFLRFSFVLSFGAFSTMTVETVVVSHDDRP